MGLGVSLDTVGVGVGLLDRDGLGSPLGAAGVPKGGTWRVLPLSIPNIVVMAFRRVGFWYGSVRGVGFG